MDAIEYEHPEAGMTATGEDDLSIYTFATARTSNSVSVMQDAILSIPLSKGVVLDREKICLLNFGQLSKQALPFLEDLRQVHTGQDRPIRRFSLTFDLK